LLLALGARGDKDAAGLLVQQAAAGPDSVRLAALESLRILAVPDTITPLLDLAAKSRSEAECEPVLNALFAVCQASSDKEAAARSVLQTMSRFSPAERCRTFAGPVGTGHRLGARRRAGCHT